ncbi:MAG: beta-lactamase family protein [Planctomyces sp.]|nr:beta-lactamase family protein [Planctomyces sp.]
MTESPPIVGIGAERFPRTLAVIEQGRQRGLHDGVQFCVRQEGETIADLAVGTSPDGRPFTPDTLLPWLSAGKPLTAYAFLKSVAGALPEGLDIPVAQTLPEFGQQGKSGITPRHLLTHQAGLAAVPVGWPQSSWEDIVRKISEAGLLPDFRVGEDAAYDPHRSWFILGELLQRACGRPIAGILQSVVCDPFDLHDTWLAMSPETHAAYGDRIGAVAARGDDGRLKTTHSHTAAFASAPSPGSSLRGPAHDLAKFYDELLDDPLRSSMAVRLRTGLFDRTFQHKIDFGLGLLINSNRYGRETVPYGFGRHASEESFGHGGAQSTIGFADPVQRLAVAAIANGLPGEAQHNRRFRELCSAIYADLGLAGDG